MWYNRADETIDYGILGSLGSLACVSASFLEDRECPVRLPLSHGICVYTHTHSMADISCRSGYKSRISATRSQ